MLTDLSLPGADGLEVLARARALHPETKVIIMTAYASTETAVAALREGAYDYLTKPFQPDEVINRIGHIARLQSVVQENRALKRTIAGLGERPIVGTSPAIERLKRTIETIAPGEHSVLIQGPSGTGKELAARAVHDRSTRAAGPFVAVNCAAIPETLLESRALRLPARRLHRRRTRPQRLLRAGAGRHPVHRRHRRHAPDDPGQAAAGHPGT